MGKTILKKKNKTGGYTLLDFRTYYEARQYEICQRKIVI